MGWKEWWSDLVKSDIQNRYFGLQVFLFLIHWGVAFAIVGLAVAKDCETFKSEFNFRYNIWNTQRHNTCEKGCTLSKESYTFEEKLNINILVAFFSIVSGTNHLIQAVWAYKKKTFQDHLEGKLNWVRFVDFGVSAGLMVIANAILFYVPPDVQTLTLWFVYQCLTQLGGYACEVLRENSAKEDSFNVFCVSGILYIVPWSLLFATFAMTTKSGLLGSDDVNTPPIQVWFFLAWIFQTFMLFPIATYYKVVSKEDPTENRIKWEIVNSLLSFVAKLPLLAVFAGGSFQRGLFTELEGTGAVVADSCAGTGEDSEFGGDTYAILFAPMAASIVGALLAASIFADELGVATWKKATKALLPMFGSLLVITFIALFPALLVVWGVEEPTSILYVSLTVPPIIFTLLWRVGAAKVFDGIEYVSMNSNPT